MDKIGDSGRRMSMNMHIADSTGAQVGGTNNINSDNYALSNTMQFGRNINISFLATDDFSGGTTH